MNNDERKDDLQRPDDNRPGDLPKGNQEPTPKPPADNPGGADPGDVGPVLHVKLPEYDAELDPESPDFNPEKWKEATGKTAEQIQEALKDTLQGFRDKMNLPAGAMLEPVKEDFARFIQESGIFEEIARQIEEMARVILEFDTEKIQKAFTLPIAGIIQGDLIREITETMLAAAIEDYKSLEPFILEELNKAGKDGDALIEIYHEAIDENGNIRKNSLFSKILKKARSEQRRLDRKENREESEALEIIGSAPNGEILNFLFKILSAKGGRIIQAGKSNRHEQIEIKEKGGAVRFTRQNKQSGEALTVQIEQANKYLHNTNASFLKVFLFALQKMTAQNFPQEVGFSLQEMVDLEMYSNIQNARRAVKDFFIQQRDTILSGSIKRGREIIEEAGGVLFYHYEIKNGYVIFSVNEKLNMNFIAPYYTVFPRFSYSLKNNAFLLMRYIFFLARQNTATIKEKGHFSVSLESVRDVLGLPNVDGVKNRKYRQYIIDPIENAIEEIEEKLQAVPEAREYGFTITPHGIDTNNINEWLKGYLEIGLRGDFAETFIRIANDAQKSRALYEKAKLNERARLAARKEAKDEKTKN